MPAETYASYPSLRRRKVIVTGGASGIGRAIVEAFVAQGARVAFLDIDSAAAQDLLASFPIGQAASAGSAHFIPCDVTCTETLKASVEDAREHLGGIQVLVNNAANDARHGLDDLTSEAFDRCMAINLKHQLFASQAAYPAISAAGGGSIICLGSIAWLNNTTAMIGYTTAKAAIHGMVRTLARQLGPHKIRVNAVLPGWTLTERQLRLWIDQEARREIAREQCLPGNVMPQDVARMVLFLAADDSAMCTQQAFVVDGGWI